MIIYIVVFSFSILILYMATRQKNKALTWILIVTALLFVCILAALRDDEVGTDVLVYARPLFIRARTSHSWMAYYMRNSRFEVGYLALNYAISRITGRISILHFVTEFIICINIVISFIELKKKDYLWFGMAIYYLVYYNQSFNLIRQTISCSFIFLVFSLLQNQKYKSAIFFFGIAMCFHTSSIIAILGIIIYFLSKKFTVKITYAICFVTILYYFVGERMALFVVDSISGLQKYRYCFSREYVYDLPVTIFLYLVFALIESIVIYWDLKNKQRNAGAHNCGDADGWNIFLLNINLISVVILPFLSGVEYLWRLSLSFNFLSMYTLIDAPEKVLIFNARGKYQRNISRGIVIAFLMLYWIVYYVILNNNETIPYVL